MTNRRQNAVFAVDVKLRDDRMRMVQLQFNRNIFWQSARHFGTHWRINVEIRYCNIANCKCEKVKLTGMDSDVDVDVDLYVSCSCRVKRDKERQRQ
jgi:hypothetical protein